MTANRKAKQAARELAAETGRSYTHAKRAESAGTEKTGQTRPEFAAGTRQCPNCHGQGFIDTDEGSIECGLCESTGSVPVPGAAVAELHRQALALAELFEQAAPLLGIYGQAARRLAELGNVDEFYAGTRQLAQDVDDLRATPNGHKTDALFRWHNNPVEAAHALARRARMVALDRCEIDEKDRACSGPRSISLAVWTMDGLSEAWPELCVQHLVDYAERWDPRYAELVIGGEYNAAREAFAELHSRRPGEHNARIARHGEDQYGRRREPVPAPSPDAEYCRFCSAPIEPGDEHEC